MLVVDELHVQAWEEYLEPAPCRNLLFRSRDAGITWEGSEDTGITEGIVPSIKELANGDLLIGVTEQFEGDDPGRGSRKPKRSTAQPTAAPPGRGRRGCPIPRG